MLRKIFIIFLSFCYAAREPPTISIPNQGTIMGKEISRSRVQKIIGYYGIPYAQPPLDNLRFAPPETDPLPSWDNVRNISDYPAACLQSQESFEEDTLPFYQLISSKNLDMQEDCLYLNVFVPYGSPPHDGFATIIWFHPGNFSTGVPSMWNPHTLVYRHRIILVTFSWRVNIMGFFTTMDGESTGNMGLLDQQAAMSWVKNNIKLFNGNPDNICLMGYGSGAVSIGIHMINPNSRELFHKVISMSSNLFDPKIIKDPQDDKIVLDKLAESFGCIRIPTSQLIECLRRVDGDLLVRETANIYWGPIIDLGLSNSSPPFLPELPRAFFQRGDFHKVPFLTGYTNMEEILTIKSIDDDNLSSNITNDGLQQIFNEIISEDIPSINDTEPNCIYNFEHILDAIMFFYGPNPPINDLEIFRKTIANFVTEKNYASSTYLQANILSKDESTFFYRFDVKPITHWAIDNIPEWVTVPHLYDLIYIWGVPYWSDFNNGNTWELRDKRISDIIMSFWTNFAKSSDPTEGSLYPIKWDPFTNEKPGILIIDGTFNMSNSKNINYKAFEFWNDFYPKVVDVATQCCNTNKVPNIYRLSPILLYLYIILIYCFSIK